MAALAVGALFTAHVAILVLSETSETGGASDVLLYESWMRTAFEQGGWPVIHFDWVYPMGALAPMVIAWGLASLLSVSYLCAWWLMVALIDLAACGLVMAIFGLRRSWMPILAWSAFVVLMGSPGLMRLDALVPPLIIVALAVAVRHTSVATVLLTVGAWIKVAPGTIVVPLAAVLWRRWRGVLIAGAVTCGVVVAVGLMAGAGLGSIFGFVGGQSGRGLQVEAVLATPLLVGRALAGDPIAVYNETLFTWEIDGPVAGWVARAADVALPLVLIVVAWFAFRARHRPGLALAAGALAAASGAIVANKVGSPQFMDWLIGPIVIGLLLRPRSTYWRINAVISAMCATLTHLIYPVAYTPFLEGNAGMILVGAIRNAIVVAILAGALVYLWRLKPLVEDSEILPAESQG
jgi:hypothetical protein